jgi:hypothetical protein
MSYILARLKEPSTYAGLAAILSAFGIGLAPEYWEAIASIGVGAAGLAAVVLAERRG